MKSNNAQLGNDYNEQCIEWFTTTMNKDFNEQ